MENSAIIYELKIEGFETFIILVVKPGIELTTPYTVTNWKNYGKEENFGFFIGWNCQEGAIIHPVIFNNQKKIFFVTEEKITSSDNFPVGSFLINGHEVIAISNGITSFKTHVFVKIKKNMFEVIERMSREANNLLETDANGPYPDALVSLWRLDGGGIPRTFLYVGALIESNWILVPRDSLDTLQPLKTIGVCTGRSYRSSSPIISFGVKAREIPGTDQFIILIIKPGIRLPTPYIANNPSTCMGRQYSGNFLGWNYQFGSVRRTVTINDFNGIHLEEEDRIRSLYFPLGSFLVIGNNIVAFSHNITAEGEPVLLKLSEDDFKAIGTYLIRVAELRKRRKRQAEKLWK